MKQKHPFPNRTIWSFTESMSNRARCYLYDERILERHRALITGGVSISRGYHRYFHIACVNRLCPPEGARLSYDIAHEKDRQLIWERMRTKAELRVRPV